MIVSVLNESYVDARSQAEESAEELEMARFIGEQFFKVFQKRLRSKTILSCIAMNPRSLTCVRLMQSHFV